MKKYAVDRIEGEFAILNFKGKCVKISLKNLPEEVTEGIIIKKHFLGNYEIDYNAANTLKSEALKKQNALFNKNTGGSND